MKLLLLLLLPLVGSAQTPPAVVGSVKIVRGGADKSYGIQVARLAGLPDGVIARAKEILANLEDGELGEQGQPKLARKRPRTTVPENQMDLFG